jgi:hypothetical protein
VLSPITIPFGSDQGGIVGGIAGLEHRKRPVNRIYRARRSWCRMRR